MEEAAGRRTADSPLLTEKRQIYLGGRNIYMIEPLIGPCRLFKKNFTPNFNKSDTLSHKKSFF